MKEINLAIGDPNLTPPKLLTDTLAVAIQESGASHYPLPFSGRPETKSALCTYYQKRHQVCLDIEQVCISHGARPALYFALRSADCSQRKCGLFTPAFPPLFDIIKDAGFALVMIEIPCNLDVDNLSLCFERLRGGVFLLNNPHNPTGRVFTRSELAVIAQLASLHDVKIISDAVYIDVFEAGEKPASLLSLSADVIEVLSLSKSFQSPGYRVGAAVGHRPWIEEFSKHYEVTNGVPIAYQRVAQAAWKNAPGISEFNSEISARRAHLVFHLRRNGFAVDTVTQNRAGIFVWSQLPEHWASSEEFTAFACNRGVIVSDGGSFGENGRNHIRWAVNETSNVIEEALDRLGFNLAASWLGLGHVTASS